MSTTLPRFARGLKLTRIGVAVMLLQLVLSIVMTVKLFGADGLDDVFDAIKWVKYFFLANIAATGVMLVGAVMAIPELARARLDIRGMVISVVGFAVATVALVWSYHVVGAFLDAVLDPDSSVERVTAAGASLESLGLVTIVKDVGYSLGLITLLRTVQRSAAMNDQPYLRDEAGHMSRALIVMLAGDLFYQLTYGLGSGGGLPFLGLAASLLVMGYWIYCHLRLVRFLGGAAQFVDLPHELPVATAVKLPEPAAPRAAAPAPRPSRPAMPSVTTTATSAPAPIVVVPPPPPAPVPRASSEASGDDSGGPKFLT